MKRLLLIFLFLFCSTLGFSQTLTFCEKVTDGTPINPSHIFTISKQGGFFSFLVVLPEAANTEEIKYDIFKVDEAGNETFYATVTNAIKKEYVWFSKEVIFMKAGDFTVYVYTADDRLLCTGLVKVVMK